MRWRLILASFVVCASACLGQTCVPGPLVSCTPYLNLWLPAYGYPNWNVPMNANSALLDNHTIVRLTTNGATGPSTYLNGVLNIPNYVGAVPSNVSVNAIVLTSPNFNNTLPAAPSGGVNDLFQVSSQNVSVYTPVATSSTFGVIKPDNTTCSVTLGVLTCGGSGSVTSFSAGTLSPLFTTSVATATTTPALTFTLSNAAQNSVFAGPASGGAGAPSFQAAPTIAVTNMTGTGAFNTTGTSGGLSGSPAITVSSCTGCGGGGAGNYVNLGGTVTFAVGSGSGSYASGTYTIATAASSVTISSIPSGYNRIHVKVNAESSSGSNDLLDIQINADTGSDYSEPCGLRRD